MKKIILYLTLIITSASFSQKIEVEKFIFKDKEILYGRVDYSKYGVANFFITMYNDVSKNEIMVNEAIKCLQEKNNLFHTLYFFLKIPNEISSLKEKNKLFLEFISHLKRVEKLQKVGLYLNFDNDYSADYKSKNKIDYKVERIRTNVHPKQICRILTIR